MLQVNNLTKTYENGVKALKGVTFEASGGLIALVGESGSGKTTLLNVLSGIDNKTSGDILIDGMDIGGARKSDRLHMFATVYQDYKLIENMSVLDNLRVAVELAGIAFDEMEIDRLLDRIGIAECKREKVYSLSGGQKQRVAIARALIKQPQIIFADEPTGNLDSENSDNIFKLLKELSTQVLIILVTHDVETASKYADRIIRLKDGSIIDDNIIYNAVPPPVMGGGTAIVSNKSKRPGISMISAKSLALAFNKAKKARRIAFMVITILLIMLTTLVANWSMISYDKLANATYARRHNSEVLMANYRIDNNDMISNSGETFDYSEYLDMTDFAGKISDELGIGSAKVYHAGSVMQYSRARYTNIMFDINEEPISMADYLQRGTPNNIILSNNPDEINIDIIEGRAPMTKGEVAIPHSMQRYFNVMGGVYDSNNNMEDSWIRLSPEQLFTYDFCGMKVVGIFEDNLNIPQEYNRYSASRLDRGKFEIPNKEHDEVLKNARTYLDNNILSNSVILSEDMEEFYNDTLYYQSDASMQGEYIYTSILSNGKYTSGYNIAPATENTAILTNIESVQPGNVVVSLNIANANGLVSGSKVTIKTEQVRGNMNLPDAHIIDKEIAIKEFTVIVDEVALGYNKILFNIDDYSVMTANYERETSNIIFGAKGFHLNDFKAISRLADEVFGENILYDQVARLEYSGDYFRELSNDYNGMKQIQEYVMIALFILLAIIIMVLGYNIISILVTAKANDLLILKSLGASKTDYLKIYSIFSLIQLAIELVIGIGIGIAMVFAFNYLLTSIITATYIVLLPLTVLPIVITMLIVTVVEALSLFINIYKIKDKNLRKSFQKAKD